VNNYSKSIKKSRYWINNPKRKTELEGN